VLQKGVVWSIATGCYKPHASNFIHDTFHHGDLTQNLMKRNTSCGPDGGSGFKSLFVAYSHLRAAAAVMPDAGGLAYPDGVRDSEGDLHARGPLLARVRKHKTWGQDELPRPIFVLAIANQEPWF
jgi:hypothetical protein